MRLETFRHMSTLCQTTSLVDAVGVSNFTVDQLKQLVDHGLKPGLLAFCLGSCPISALPSAVNQIECHPMHTQRDVREYCACHGIVVSTLCVCVCAKLLPASYCPCSL
jgi:diketogulonate reductase-like aldo/keto reductase